MLKSDDCHEKECAEDYNIFVSEKIVAPQCVVAYTKNQLPFFTFDNFQNFIFSSSCQAFCFHQEEDHVFGYYVTKSKNDFDKPILIPNFKSNEDRLHILHASYLVIHNEKINMGVRKFM